MGKALFYLSCDMRVYTVGRKYSQNDSNFKLTLERDSSIGIPANIHLVGQTEFCPNGKHKLFVTRPCQGEK